MRVLLCGGGTAGHVNPAIAIGETIIKNLPESKIAYVATLKGIENELVHFKKYHINVSGLKKGISISNFKSLYRMLVAEEKCKEIIKEFCPDVIIGTGGYATYPVIKAGHKLGIKTIVHESNVLPGKAIRMLENHTDMILTNFKESEKYFKKRDKVFCVGNPIRSGFKEGNKDELKTKAGIVEKYVVLCYGGSLGAEKINDSAISVIENLIRSHKDVRLILSTGKRNYYDVCEKLKKKRLDRLENVSVHEYIYDMQQKMAMADIVISRSGAITITELASMKKCAILIPSPNVANDHQLKNALALEEKGACVMITEDKLYSLTDTIKELIENSQARSLLEENIEAFYLPEANKRIYNLILKLIQKGK